MCEWLVAPYSFDHFLSTVCERGTLLITRPHAPATHTGCFAADDVWALLESGRLRYGESVDVTHFTAERQRQTFNYNGDNAPDPDTVRLLMRASWLTRIPAGTLAIKSRSSAGLDVLAQHRVLCTTGCAPVA